MDEIKPELVDELLKGYQKPEDVIGESGLLKRLTKALLERAMNRADEPSRLREARSGRSQQWQLAQRHDEQDGQGRVRRDGGGDAASLSGPCTGGSDGGPNEVDTLGGRCIFAPGVNFWNSLCYAAQILAPVTAAAPAEDPLTCSFVGATFAGPGFGKVDRSGSEGYYTPAAFTYSASGGNGSYSWNNTQTIRYSGQIEYESRVVYGSALRTPPEHLASRTGSTTGSRITWVDYPGLQRESDTFGRIVSANITWSFTLNVTVTSGAQTIDCPATRWTATQTWKKVNRQQVVTGNGGGCRETE